MTIYAHQPTWSDEEITFWVKLWADLTDPIVGFAWEWRVGDIAWLPSWKAQAICVVASQEEIRFLDPGRLFPLGNLYGPIPLPSYDVIVAMEKSDAGNPYFYHAIEIEETKDFVTSWMPFWRSPWDSERYLSRRSD